MAGVFRITAIIGALALLTACGGEPAPTDEAEESSADDIASAEISWSHVRGPIYVLFGPGGNIGVYAGASGVYLIDDQFAPLTDKVIAAIREFSDQPILFVLNTHWHGDHVGGNENLGGTGVVIVAHDNVRARMSMDQAMETLGQTIPAAPDLALPVITFSDEASFRLDGVEARIRHIPNAHTDGDSIVEFPDLGVIHMGDVLILQGYTFIDVDSGGDIDGILNAVQEMHDSLTDDQIVIPGHGPLAGRAELAAFLDVHRTIRDRVKERIDQGLTLDQIIAQKITSEWDKTHTNPYVTGESLVRAMYRTLTNPPG